MNAFRNLVAGLALAGSAVCAAVPASAGDHYNWSGMYFGGHAGYSWANVDSGLVYPFGNAGSPTFDLDGAVAGGHIGAQHQFGRWVIGAEVSLTSGFDGQTLTGINLFAPGVGEMRSDIDWLVTATGRLGYAWDHWLAYVKGGYAGAMVEISADDNVPPDWGFERRDMHHGWTVGVGAEYQIRDGIVLGLEYNYVNLNEDFTSPVVVLANNAPVGPNALMDIDTSLHSITARLSFKLGRPEEHHDSLK
ncbi:MAG: outer membrane beta-barrel protein [Hyphomicrobiaceae bacterium]|nr:outer membrane beta-barrel protein [Hyphomicrobiaceae bacterium]